MSEIKIRRRVNSIGAKVINYEGEGMFGSMVDDGQTDEEVIRKLEADAKEHREWLARWKERVDRDFGGDEAAARAAGRRGLGERMDEEARTSMAIHRRIRAAGEVERLAAIFGMEVEISVWGSIYPDARSGSWVTPEMVRRGRNAAQSCASWSPHQR